VEVHRNDKISIEEIARRKPERIVISPGPCTPQEAGISIELIQRLAGKISDSWSLPGTPGAGRRLWRESHSRAEIVSWEDQRIHHDNKGVFRKLPEPFTATRYHSLIVERKSLPRELTITAETSDGIIMGVRHRKHKLEGVQFHPESVLTESGKQLLENFLSLLKFHGVGDEPWLALNAVCGGRRGEKKKRRIQPPKLNTSELPGRLQIVSYQSRPARRAA